MAMTLEEATSSFSAATETALLSLPDSTSLLPPDNGITLLDAKNEIFLSYLQALALRNLHVIRSIKDGVDAEDAKVLSNDITKTLVEHRVYLERGVRPLEQKIKYQVEKVVKAADDEDAAVARKANAAAKVNGAAKTNGGAEDGENSDEEEDSSDEDELDQLAYRPNAGAMKVVDSQDANASRQAKSKEDGVYRPPRISATAMPTTETREKKQRRPGRSSTVDEYINAELSTAPMAEPSIGSTITAGGRSTKDRRQLAKEKERQEYEETNLVRLPKESDKKKGARGARDRQGGFGGEEWRGLGDTVDRIGDLTRRKGKESALDKSRKRRAVEDGQRDSGIGDAFDVKKRRMMKKMRN